MCTFVVYYTTYVVSSGFPILFIVYGSAIYATDKGTIYTRFAGGTLLSVNDEMNCSSPQAIKMTFFSIVKYLSEKKISFGNF